MFPTSSSERLNGELLVVIVDDSQSSLNVLELLIGKLTGCKAYPFSVSRAALDWCVTNDPDLILVDYQMPPPDGLEFIEAYRTIASNAETPVVMITSSLEKDVRRRALRVGATDFLTKPLDEDEFLARTRNLLKLRQSHRAMLDRAQWLHSEIAKATRTLLEREREAVLFLARAAEHRDPETGDHILRMAEYSRLIAEATGLGAEEVGLIYSAAPLHDVGKIGIPDRILLKPGKLDDEEFAIMKLHTIYGAEILAGSSSPLLRMAATIALSHHERFDGGGYPYGLAGESIPFAARITALADVFDALTTERPYKPAWPLGKAYDYIGEMCGRHFDPVCVDAFLARWTDITRIIQSRAELCSVSTSVLDGVCRPSLGDR